MKQYHLMVTCIHTLDNPPLWPPKSFLFQYAKKYYNDYNTSIESPSSNWHKRRGVDLLLTSGGQIQGNAHGRGGVAHLLISGWVEWKWGWCGVKGYGVGMKWSEWDMEWSGSEVSGVRSSSSPLGIDAISLNAPTSSWRGRVVPWDLHQLPCRLRDAPSLGVVTANYDQDSRHVKNMFPTCLLTSLFFRKLN